MKKIYQKNISGAKNALKRKFGALMTISTTIKKWLICQVKTYRHDFVVGRNNIEGFTLIELLVVVVIIGILAAAALPQYQRAVYKSKFSKLLLLSRAYNEAGKVYYLANGTWPTEFDELDVTLPAGVDKLTPTSSDCGLFDDMYCCLKQGVSNYQNAGIACGLGNYILGIDRFAAGNEYCLAKTTDTNAKAVCQSMSTGTCTSNMATPTGHREGYTCYTF